MFGAPAVRRLAELREGGGRREARHVVQELWDGLPDAHGVIREAVRDQYRRMFAALPAPTYVIPGNVDMPELWPEFLRDGVYHVDGQVVTIGERRVGFVGGGLLPPGVSAPHDGPWRSYLRTPDEFGTTVRSLLDDAGASGLDLLCSHIPPAIPDLCYDVVARGGERGSEDLLGAIREGRPRMAVFGHVHQPLSPRVRVGHTECVNVGHFQRTESAQVVRW